MSDYCHSFFYFHGCYDTLLRYKQSPLQFYIPRGLDVFVRGEFLLQSVVVAGYVELPYHYIIIYGVRQCSTEI
ncbi:unnamed protein product [Penicillium roqueforti FM164]|uniref:Uncharacterized protein n=1 Tax=Penicillium roqueforti (strain FM164) TaxID=1365484 RepID=W6QQB1_PENRF|nr:unnamed protein product [Penicillium roqueforti FM164]